MSASAFPVTSAAIADLQRATERLRAANARLRAVLGLPPRQVQP